MIEDTMPPDPHPPSDLPPLRAELLDDVLARVEAEPAPDRRTSRRARIGLALLCFGLAAAVFVAYGGLRDGGSPRPPALILATALGAALIAAFSLWLGAGQRSMLARPAGALVAVLVLIPMLLFGWKVGWSALVEGAMVRWPERIGIPCVQISLLSGAGPLLALVWIERRGEPNHPALLGAAMGVTAGAFAWVVTDLWCPVGHVPHLLVGHLLPMLILGLAGAALGASWLGIRWSGPGAA